MIVETEHWLKKAYDIVIPFYGTDCLFGYEFDKTNAMTDDVLYTKLVIFAKSIIDDIEFYHNLGNKPMVFNHNVTSLEYSRELIEEYVNTFTTLCNHGLICDLAYIQFIYPIQKIDNEYYNPVIEG